MTDNEAEETAVGVWEKDTLTGPSHLYSIRIAITDFFCCELLESPFYYDLFPPAFLLDKPLKVSTERRGSINKN